MFSIRPALYSLEGFPNSIAFTFPYFTIASVSFYVQRNSSATGQFSVGHARDEIKNILVLRARINRSHRANALRTQDFS